MSGESAVGFAEGRQLTKFDAERLYILVMPLAGQWPNMPNDYYITLYGYCLTYW